MNELRAERIAEITEYFVDNIWELNPSGNFDQIINIFCEVERIYYPTWTCEKVGQRYIDYFNKWQLEHIDQEEKYIGKDDKLMDIIAFITRRGYEKEYAIVKKGRDFYLFGNDTKESLLSSVGKFNEKMSHGRK